MSEIQFTAGVSFAADMLDAVGIALSDKSKTTAINGQDGGAERTLRAIAYAYHEFASALRDGRGHPSLVAEKLERHKW